MSNADCDVPDVNVPPVEIGNLELSAVDDRIKLGNRRSQLELHPQSI